LSAIPSQGSKTKVDIGTANMDPAPHDGWASGIALLAGAFALVVFALYKGEGLGGRKQPPGG
jgi:hypothetical protein